MAHDALGAHAREELGIHETTRARPVQAAVASAASFAAGAAPSGAPRGAVAGRKSWRWAIVGVTLGLLLVIGGVAARLGGAPLARGRSRVAFWGAVAMGVLQPSGASSARSSSDFRRRPPTRLRSGLAPPRADACS